MPTTKKRINLSVSDRPYGVLRSLAREEGVTPTTKALDLLKEAMELKEDEHLQNIAEKRDVKGARFLSHDTVWK